MKITRIRKKGREEEERKKGRKKEATYRARQVKVPPY